LTVKDFNLTLTTSNWSRLSYKMQANG